MQKIAPQAKSEKYFQIWFSPIWGENGGVLSMRMQVILDSSFARPGSAAIWGGKKGEFRDWTKYYYSLTSTYRCLRVCSSELVRILCQHPPPGIWLSILRWPEGGRLGGQQKTRNKSAWSSPYSPGLTKSYFMSSAI